MKIKYIALLLSVCILLSCNKNNESVLLRLKYNKGDEQVFELDENAIAGTYFSMHNQTEVSMIVDSVTNNGNSIVMTAYLKSVKSDTKTGEKIEHYDSNDKYSDMDEEALALDKTLQEALHSYYSIEFNSRGEVTRPFSLAGKSVAAPVDAAKIQLIFPDEKVKVGYSWAGQPQTTFLSTTNTYTYTVTDITKDNVIIHVDANIQGFKSLTKDHKAEGEYVINKTNGRLISSRLDMPVQTGGRVVLTVTAK